MTQTQIVLVTKKVTASAHVRHAATVNVVEPGNVASILIPARRGPIGPQGEQGPAGEVGTDAIIDGGNF